MPLCALSADHAQDMSAVLTDMCNPRTLVSGCAACQCGRIMFPTLSSISSLLTGLRKTLGPLPAYQLHRNMSSVKTLFRTDTCAMMQWGARGPSLVHNPTLHLTQAALHSDTVGLDREGRYGPLLEVRLLSLVTQTSLPSTLDLVHKLGCCNTSAAAGYCTGFFSERSLLRPALRSSLRASCSKSPGRR